MRGEKDRAWIESAFHAVEENDQNILARAWNRGIKRCLNEGCHYILVINLDLVFHPSCVDSLVSYGEAHPEALLWSGTNWNNLSTLSTAVLETSAGAHTQWSCFMIRPAILEKVGFFDEQFIPAYLEDCDMRYRLSLIGHGEINLNAALFYHLERGTMKGLLDGSADDVASNFELLDVIEKGMAQSGEKYLKKWGGLPLQEKFKKPYG